MGWLGGLALDGLETHGDPATEPLIRTARAIADGEPIRELALLKAMPPWLYRLGGNVMWRRESKETAACVHGRTQTGRPSSRVAS